MYVYLLTTEICGQDHPRGIYSSVDKALDALPKTRLDIPRGTKEYSVLAVEVDRASVDYGVVWTWSFGDETPRLRSFGYLPGSRELYKYQPAVKTEQGNVFTK